MPNPWFNTYPDIKIVVPPIERCPRQKWIQNHHARISFYPFYSRSPTRQRAPWIRFNFQRWFTEPQIKLGSISTPSFTTQTVNDTSKTEQFAALECHLTFIIIVSLNNHHHHFLQRFETLPGSERNRNCLISRSELIPGFRVNFRSLIWQDRNVLLRPMQRHNSWKRQIPSTNRFQVFIFSIDMRFSLIGFF